MHIRQVIVLAIKNEVTGLAITQDRVYLNRGYPSSLETFPALFLFTTEEEVKPLELGSMGHSKRLLTFVIEIISTDDQAESQLNSIAEEVENKLHKNRDLSGKSLDIQLFESKWIVEAGEQRVLRLQLYFLVQYLTENNNSSSK